MYIHDVFREERRQFAGKRYLRRFLSLWRKLGPKNVSDVACLCRRSRRGLQTAYVITVTSLFMKLFVGEKFPRVVKNKFVRYCLVPMRLNVKLTSGKHYH
ncbi:hypothetical protein EVAR_29191_1 [Eumeta japonica]|uniref:Uncharacterized protein n=1 Tax=Eumeta variegata TaxID=151549 RepID=A0A4C1VC08_EUMVA|nr:hypothetical protein EVAR_29191_1 [Eumeta japonica]